ncbi:TniQ family protein [Paenibacillus sp. TAB 01]|uniref:TniQ family protein n=1 Tax=Paenibacillus sp. TAB 01 TaxID=3368988 RepID=UPI003750B45B
MKRRLGHNESLFSYFINLSHSFGTDVLVLLETMKLNEKFRLHSGDLKRIDFYPMSLLNASKITAITGLSYEEVHRSSFANVIRTFNESAKGESSRILNKIIRDKLSYCPECLRSSKTYPLLWKIDTIDTCIIHKNKLNNCCGHCKETIAYQSIREVNRCPHCSNRLSEVIGSKEEISEVEMEQQVWFTENWEYLLNYTGESLTNSETALRLLYILNECQSYFNRKIIVAKRSQGCVEHLLQCARGTLQKRRSVHLSNLLFTLYKMKTHVKDFLVLSVPQEFVDSLHEKSIGHLAKMTACEAPWCEKYGEVGELVPTGVLNTTKSGEHLSYYMVCKSCGCEYAFNEGKKLVERGYFINAYKILKTRDITRLTWPEKEKIFGLKRDRIRRVMAYFHNQNVIVNDIHKGKIDAVLLERFIRAFSEGVSLEEVRYWREWQNYEQFLLHRYHSSVIKASVESSGRQKINATDSFYKKRIESTCKKLIKENITINLPNVALAAGTSATTIRNKQCSELVGIYRKRQVKAMRQNRIRLMEEEIDAYFAAHSDERIYTQKLYAATSVDYLYLKRYAPWLLEKIEQMKLEHNKEIFAVAS